MRDFNMRDFNMRDFNKRNFNIRDFNMRDSDIKETSFSQKFCDIHISNKDKDQTTKTHLNLIKRILSNN